jgi:hypothetical protein
VDPVTLSSAAVGVLVAYFSRLSEDAAGATSPAARRLYERIKQRLSGSPGEFAHLARVEEQPGSQPRQAALRASLAALFDERSDLARELEPLIDDGVREAGAQSLVQFVRDAGIVAAGDVRQVGANVAGRDQTIRGS